MQCMIASRRAEGNVQCIGYWCPETPIDRFSMRRLTRLRILGVGTRFLLPVKRAARLPLSWWIVWRESAIFTRQYLKAAKRVE